MFSTKNRYYSRRSPNQRYLQAAISIFMVGGLYGATDSIAQPAPAQLTGIAAATQNASGARTAKSSKMREKALERERVSALRTPRYSKVTTGSRSAVRPPRLTSVNLPSQALKIAELSAIDISKVAPAATRFQAPARLAAKPRPQLVALDSEAKNRVLLAQAAPAAAPAKAPAALAPATPAAAAKAETATPAAPATAPAVAAVPEAPIALVAATEAPVALAASATPAPAPAAPALPAEVRRNAEGEPLITNSFFETDLRQALADVALQAGVPIIADNTVQGTVTLDLNDVPLERALLMLLQGGGYSFVEMDGYYLVGNPDPANPNFHLLSRTEVVQLRHLRPEVIMSLLSVPYGRYLSSEGSTHVPTARGGSDSGDFRRSLSGSSYGGYGGSSSQRDNRGSADIGLPAPTYKIAITAPPSLIERIKADIQRLDQQRPQVMLEAMVLEVSQDAFKEFGLNIASRWLKFNTTTSSSGSNFQYSSIANDELAQITALVQNGVARLRANPRVATGDGQTAEVEVGRENYFSIVSGSLNYAYNTLEVIRSGISLRITPRILDDTQEVLALVEPEVRDVTGRGPNGLPEITFRRAATNVRVRNGSSIVIAGLLNEFDVNSESKIPILGDIPVLGKLFRGKNTRKVKNETIIIITPRILVDENVPDLVQSPILQNDLNMYRTGEPLTPFAFPPKKKK